MNPAIPRMHMCAGPNGLGKSMIDGFNSELFWVYTNPADIKKEILRHGTAGLMYPKNFGENAGKKYSDSWQQTHLHRCGWSVIPSNREASVLIVKHSS
jgi:hypothetical protein